MSRKTLLTVWSLLAVVCFAAASANADPRMEFRTLTSEFERHDSGLHLALGHLKNHHSSSAVSMLAGKRSGFGDIAGLTFSVPAPDDCRLDSFRPCTKTAPTSSAPEPATMLLLGTGLAGVAGLMRRQRRIRRSSQSD